MEDYKNHSLYKSHSFDTLFGDTLKFYRKHFLTLFTIAFLGSLVTQFIATRVDYGQLMMTDPYDPDIDLIMSTMGRLFGIMALSILFTIAMNLFLFYYIFHRELKPDMPVVNLLGRALTEQGIPFFVIALLFGILLIFGVFIGFFLLVIGALVAACYLGTVLTFAAPNLIAEQKGIGSAIGRSFDLAHRQFWSSLGYILVMVILLIIVGMLLSSILLAPFAGKFLKLLTDPGTATATEGMLETATSPWYVILSAAVNALTAPIFPIFAFALYFKVKKSEDDGEPAGSFSTSKGQTPGEQGPSVDDLMPKNRPENNELQ